MVHVLHVTSYKQNAHYLGADELTGEERKVVEAEWGPVREGVYWHLGEREED